MMTLICFCQPSILSTVFIFVSTFVQKYTKTHLRAFEILKVFQGLYNGPARKAGEEEGKGEWRGKEEEGEEGRGGKERERNIALPVEISGFGQLQC